MFEQTYSINGDFNLLTYTDMNVKIVPSYQILASLPVTLGTVDRVM